MGEVVRHVNGFDGALAWSIHPLHDCEWLARQKGGSGTMRLVDLATGWCCILGCSGGTRGRGE
jgi:hypothetical protein